METIPTPEEFADEMKEASTINRKHEDQEDTHRRMDYLMCDLLRKLGYDEAVDIFEKSPRWYA